MKQRTLPGSGIQASVLGLGTWGLGGENDVDGTACGWRSVDFKDAQRVVYAALDNGITFFDTADFYGRGRSEEILGSVLAGRDVVVATKVGILPRMRLGTNDLDRDFSARHILESVESSLRRLRRESVDFLQLHGADPRVLASIDTLEALDHLRRSGKVRGIGVSLRSSAGPDELAWWTVQPRIAAVQTPYTLLDARSMMRTRQVRGTHAGILGRSLLAHGLLAGAGDAGFDRVDHRARKAAKMILGIEGVLGSLRTRGIHGPRAVREAILAHAVAAGAIDVALVGATSPDQVRENVHAVERAISCPHLVEIVDDVLAELCST